MNLSRIRTVAVAALAFAAGALFTGLRFAPAVEAAGDHVFELRVYHTFPGRLPALEARFRDHTISIFNRHGMTSIGYWTPQDAPGSENTLIYILAHPSREAAAQHWKEFAADPEWQKVAKESEADGKIVEKVDSTFMKPADFSAMK